MTRVALLFVVPWYLHYHCPYLKIIAKILLYFHYIFLKREMIINELFGQLSHILLHQWKKFCPYTKVINLSSHVPLNYSSTHNIILVIRI